MKVKTVDTVIQDFREGQNIFRRPSVELMVREISRQAKRIEELEIHNKNLHLACVSALDLHRESDVPKLKDIPKIIEELRTRAQELEQERRWIPVEELSETIRALVYMGNDYTVIATYHKNTDKWKNDCGAIVENAIKYQPLPQPPSEEE